MCNHRLILWTPFLLAVIVDSWVSLTDILSVAFIPVSTINDMSYDNFRDFLSTFCNTLLLPRIKYRPLLGKYRITHTGNIKKIRCFIVSIITSEYNQSVVQIPSNIFNKKNIIIWHYKIEDSQWISLHSYFFLKLSKKDIFQ